MNVGDAKRRKVSVVRAIWKMEYNIEEFIEMLRDAADGLENVSVSIDIGEALGGDYEFFIFITGYSPATQEDVDEHDERNVAQKSQQEKDDLAVLRRLLNRNPNIVEELKGKLERSHKFREIRKQKR